MQKLLSVNQAIEKVLKERLFEIEAIKISASSQMIEYSKKMLELHEQVRSYLSEEGNQAFVQYDELVTEMYSLELYLVYRQGLRDGLALPKAWGGAAI